MALFGALMARMAAADAGVVSDETAAFLASPQPLPEKRWVSWVRAEQARLRGDTGRSSRWLDVAGHVSGKPQADTVWTAEYSLTTGELLMAEGEPGQAFGYLREAFEAWQSISKAMLAPPSGVPRDRSVGRAVSEFARVLLGDDTRGIDPGSPSVMVSWMQERLIPQTLAAGLSLIRLAKDVGGTESAERTAGRMLEWLPKVVTGQALNIFVADVHDHLGTHYQNVGRAEDAVREAEVALAALASLSADPTMKRKILQLTFNRANSLARAGKETEAVAVYEALEAAFSAEGETEAALRTRYARLHAQWRTTRGTAVRDDLRQLVADYEELLRTGGTAQYAKTKVVLEPAYRLLLTVVAQIGPQDIASLQELFAIVGALRGESSIAEPDRIADVPSIDSRRLLTAPIALLDRRLRRVPDALLFIIEPGVDCVVFISLKGGDEALPQRLTVATAGADFAAAAAAVIDEVHTASHILIARAGSARGIDAAPMMKAAETFTRAVPEALRQALVGATTILYSPSLMGDADDIPLELMRIGDGYLALSHVIARVPSLAQLLQILAPNRANRVSPAQAVVVRAADPPELDHLSSADEDVAHVLHALGVLGLAAKPDHAPAPAELIRTLDSGIRLVHYVGHGMAVEAGEHLYLSPEARLPAFQLEALDGSRTPFVFLSTCLVGRGRHLAGGRLKGFAAALLRHGTPGIVAASYVVPDHVCGELSRAFYRGAWKNPAGEAMRQARVQMNAEGFHPVCWTTFSLHGDPYATISEALQADSAAQRTCDWPALLTRFLATQEHSYRRACRERLADAAKAHPEHAATLRGVAASLESGADAAGVPASLINEVSAFDVEGAAAVRMLDAWRRVEALPKKGGSAADQDRCRQEIGTGLSLALALQDSYAFLVFAVEHSQRLLTSMEEMMAVLRQAARCGRALEADERGLRRHRARIEEMLDSLESSIVFDAPALLGVDPEMLQRADDGDEDALREINSQLMAKEAEVDVAIAGGDWTEWMLRYIGTDSASVLSGLMAVVDHDKRAAGGRREIADLLWRYLSSYRGEGEADPELRAKIRDKLPPGGRELRVMTLFGIFDQIVSHPEDYAPPLASQGLSLAKQLGHEGAAAYFQMLVAEANFREGRPTEARDLLLALLQPLQGLAAQDPEYRRRLQVAVQNAIAISQAIGDRKGAKRVQAEFGDVLGAGA